MEMKNRIFIYASVLILHGCATISDRTLPSLVNPAIGDEALMLRVRSDLSGSCVELFSTTRTGDGKPGYQSSIGLRRHFAAGFDDQGRNISCAWQAGGWMRFSEEEVKASATRSCDELMPRKSGCQIYADGNEIVFNKGFGVEIPKIADGTPEQSASKDFRQENPNSLPLCPKLDHSKPRDLGAGGRTEKWHNCWGEYKIELDKVTRGDVLRVEWRNGLPNGHGTRLALSWNQWSGDKYVGEFKDGQFHGQGTYYFLANNQAKGDIYRGGFRDSKMSGLGSYTRSNGDKFVGEYREGNMNGQGIATFIDGRVQEGLWENNQFIREAKVTLPNTKNDVSANIDRTEIDRERQQLAQERRRIEEDKRQRAEEKRSQRLSLAVSNTQPSSDGSFIINIQTNSDTASLLINGEEQGGRVNGDYIVKKVARAGQDTKFTIVATDINGNADTKTITVSRQVVESKAIYAALNPTKVKKQPDRDAVAVVIGIADYRSLPKAEYANDDARAFYDYAIRALGVKPENIKLLVDGDAEEAEILKTFRTWVPSRVKATTDVYVYYSGHGLPTPDGQGLYLLPPRADREVIDDTAIPFSKINAALQLAKPRSVTIFMDACYSGQARSGETLVASARPISLRTENRLFPDGFTVISASQHDQISSSSPDLQHGIFSYYLMRGMEGDADANKDGKITLGEMQVYLSENVARQAAMMSRKQEPQLIGDANRVLVGR